MKKKTDSLLRKKLLDAYNYFIKNKTIIIVTVISFFLLSLITYLGLADLNSVKRVRLQDFEPGKVADRDIITSRNFSYIDENASLIRKKARQNLVPAIFSYDQQITNKMLEKYDNFVIYIKKSIQTSTSESEFLLEIQQEYPGLVNPDILHQIYSQKNRDDLLQISRDIYALLLQEGIIAFPDKGMEDYNQTDIELLILKSDRQERSIVTKDSLITKDTAINFIENSLLSVLKQKDSINLIYNLVLPFITENIIYQSVESEAKIDVALKQVAPVVVSLPKGHKIIKRGFIITEEAFTELKAFSNAGLYIDIRHYLGTLLCLLITVLIGFFIFNKEVFGLSIEFKKQLLIIVLFIIQYIFILFVSRGSLFSHVLDVSKVMTVAIMTMTITLLINQRTGVFSSFLFMLATFCASNFSLSIGLFALFSGIAGVSVTKITGKRLDLVFSACILALVQPILLYILLLVFPAESKDSTMLLVGGAINGFMNGIVLLGILPIFEAALNTSTSFRLMEFSDLNSPIMKKMLLTISGTYNHSIMVATLAETACREIGADPLIARVGAYYHDIGKMDQSEYFVENQTSHNKHLDLNPRLSATIIRSHVKQGVEKARQLRLPKEVIDIILEHHGDSLISYFYIEAKKQNPDVDPEDYMYPGPKPRTKESAVVMLADVVEAACRTLDKPTIPRLEKFIDDLVNKKIESNQLDNCDLTFREIKLIKTTFVTILAGYYHSRIEYQNQKDPDDIKPITETKKNIKR